MSPLSLCCVVIDNLFQSLRHPFLHLQNRLISVVYIEGWRELNKYWLTEVSGIVLGEMLLEL